MKVNSVLFVCLGNICRSPTAEAVFRALAKQHLNNLAIKVDSAGTSGAHAGQKPDPRSISASFRRGYDLTSIHSRQFNLKDFDNFDLILVMDKSNKNNILKLADNVKDRDVTGKIKLFLDFSKQVLHQEVPDPYYGGEGGFDLVIDLIEDASFGLIEVIKKSNK